MVRRSKSPSPFLLLLLSSLSTAFLLAPASAQAVAPAAAPTKAASSAPAVTDPSFPRYLLDQVDDQFRGSSSHSIMRMQVKSTHWERSMRLEGWTLNKDYSLIRILEPKKERGTATLKALFTYLSKTGRTIKISDASMGGAWMGSHFTNDDLIKNSRLADDFTYTLTNGPTIKGEDTWVVVLIPKPRAAVVWGRVDVMIRKSDLLPAAQLFYSEDLKPIRKLEFSDYIVVGTRKVASRMRMTPLDQSGEFTEIFYENLSFDVHLSPDFFSLQKLKSI